MFTRFAVLSLVLFSPSLAQAAPAPISGLWLTEIDKGLIRMSSCGANMCATIMGPSVPAPKDAPPAYDVKNGDKKLRSRLLKGLVILSDAKPNGDHWQGHIYSPNDGRIFPASFNAEADGTLRVKGCWGFICMTQYWKPVKQPA